MPTKPALAPTINITASGAPDVIPYSVIFRYFWNQGVIVDFRVYVNTDKPHAPPGLAGMKR